MFPINASFLAHCKMGNGMPAIRNKPGNGIGINLMGGQPAFIQAHHASEIPARRMAAYINALRRAAIVFNIAEGPCHCGGGVLDVRWRFHFRMQSIIHRHYRDALLP